MERLYERCYFTQTTSRRWVAVEAWLQSDATEPYKRLSDCIVLGFRSRERDRRTTPRRAAACILGRVVIPSEQLEMPKRDCRRGRTRLLYLVLFTVCVKNSSSDRYTVVNVPHAHWEEHLERNYRKSRNRSKVDIRPIAQWICWAQPGLSKWLYKNWLIFSIVTLLSLCFHWIASAYQIPPIQLGLYRSMSIQRFTVKGISTLWYMHACRWLYLRTYMWFTEKYDWKECIQ